MGSPVYLTRLACGSWWRVSLAAFRRWPFEFYISWKKPWRDNTTLQEWAGQTLSFLRNSPGEPFDSDGYAAGFFFGGYQFA
jgi:hypothetical protein